MMAQRTNAEMKFDARIVSLSVVIAFITANAAFWIIFRAVRHRPVPKAWQELRVTNWCSPFLS